MTRTQKNIDLGGALTCEGVEAVARESARVTLTDDALRRIRASNRGLRDLLESGATFYGVNTGFGALGKQRIAPDSLRELQVNLVRSHATGVGASLPRETVRATMLLLAASLSRGHSGIRPELVELLVECLNREVTPAVPQVGSVGASGDLAPLAHIALVLIGDGEALGDGGARIAARKALHDAGLEPICLEPKEGLALINGTHLMAGEAALLVRDFERLFEAALVATAMSVDTCRATDSTLDAAVHELRAQPGQILVARRLRNLLRGSEIVQSHAEDDPRVQDPYSFRCSPAVLGAALDAFGYVRTAVETELGAVTDNPLVVEVRGGGPERRSAETVRIVSGGNFHGLPVAVPLDVLAIATAHVAGISERRVYHMLSGIDPEAELPTFLTPQAGIQSGLMIAQYAAAASCNELVGLSSPASVVNLPTSAGMEDYNSFGPRSAAKARRGLELARSVVAIELLCAATGLDHHRPLRSGERVERAYDVIRTEVAPLEEDRPPSPDIARIERLIESGAIFAQ